MVRDAKPTLTRSRKATTYKRIRNGIIRSATLENTSFIADPQFPATS